MLGESRGGVSSFGWSVTCPGRRPAELQAEVDALASWTERAWQSHFPAERGYVIETEHPADEGDATRLLATRGDFSARLSIEPAERSSETTPLRVRIHGSAASARMIEAERVAARRVTRGRAIGAGAGLTLFAGLCWLSLGVADPIFVLGGLLMVVALVTTTFVGASMGAYFGERLGEIARRRARALAEGDPGLKTDLRRWKAITRQLLQQRAAFLGGRTQQPFRRPA